MMVVVVVPSHVSLWSRAAYLLLHTSSGVKCGSLQVLFNSLY